MTKPATQRKSAAFLPPEGKSFWPADAGHLFEQALDAIPEGATADVVRTEIVRWGKSVLATARDQAKSILETRGGMACAQSLSDAQDAIIRALFRFVTTRMYPLSNPTAGERITVCAVGGYGRRTLAPGSDIDILFLFAHSTPWGESIAEAMLYPLWDLGLKVGHATRTVDECIKAAQGDMTVRTALLEARPIIGDEALFVEFQTRFDKDVVTGTAAEFVQAKLAEREARVERAGSSRYLVEPNVKEGKGGLRDLQTLFWIAQYTYRVRERDQLVEAGLFTRRELELFKRCEEFLWRVRCHMHFATGRAEERLNFELQRIVAERLNYRARGALRPVERFMKHYFLVAKDVGDLTAIVTAAVEVEETRPTALLDRVISKLRRRRALSGTKDFLVDNGRITVTEDDVFQKDPVNFLRLYWYSDKYQLPVHPDATRLITLSLGRIDARLREDREANRLFLDILTSRNNPESVLRRMHASGVLGRFIPDFARINAMMQFSMYHHYTVDEHTLRAIGILSEIEQGKMREAHPVAHDLILRLSNRTVLYVALFLHDIGKGRDEPHEIVGEAIARDLCPRFGMSKADTETVAWLVRHHLDMSQTAQSRDISDPRTIANFAEIVQTIERLRLLIILTICDIRAVGPGVWNGWKGQLLRALYWETETQLAGGHTASERDGRVQEAKAKLRAELKDWSDEAFADYAQRHNAGYWSRVDFERQVRHARMLEKVDRSGQRFQTDIATNAFQGVTEVTVFAIDHPRLLAIVTGACAAAGANIAEAQIFTTSDGMALDSIFISRAFDRDEDELRRAERVADHIIKALKGEIRLPDVVASRAAMARRNTTFVVSPHVSIDNKLSAKSTVVEVTGLDRPGLLYELTTEFGKMNLNIISARIVTYGEKAVDVFYVTDLMGGKIDQTSRQALIARSLLEVLEPPAITSEPSTP
ncbi:MAG: [protein-PII] uridylyltransferase [Proteobacteria bacterium]|nr:[protein-PII] uridylyltransferase [Pseudomonadota bacterium]